MSAPVILPFSVDNLNALNVAISNGVLRVRFADREQEYNSISQMIIARNLMLQQLAPTGIRRQLRVMTGSGW